MGIIWVSVLKKLLQVLSTLNVQNALSFVFISFFLSFLRSVGSNYISSSIYASAYYTALPTPHQTASFHTTFVLRSTCIKEVVYFSNIY
jgi:hypothetical protein